MLNPWGRVADECWRAVPDHFPYVELRAHVVMPNHVHGILSIQEIESPVGAKYFNHRGTIYRAPMENAEQFGKPVVGSIPTIIRTFKAAVTRRLGCEFGVSHIWQRNYYEYIIRDEKDLSRIYDYIESNPLTWPDDNENPKNQPLPE